MDITGVPDNHVCSAGRAARYAAPTIGSMLPSYSNYQNEFIINAFSRVGFQSIHDLPADIASNSVVQRRLAIQEAAKTFMPGAVSFTARPPVMSEFSKKTSQSMRHAGLQKTCNSIRNQCTLFSTFDYIPHDYDAAQQQANADRAQSKAAQSKVSLHQLVVSNLNSEQRHGLFSIGQNSRLQEQTLSLLQQPIPHKHLGLMGSSTAHAIHT